MAYSDLDTEIVYTGDNSTTIFPINFARTDESYVQAELWDISDPDNPVKLTFANPGDWQIVGNDVVADTAPKTNQQVFIYRSGTPINETDFTEYEFPYATMNVTLDKVYQLAQENKAALARTISNPHFNAASGNGSLLTFEEVYEATQTDLEIADELQALQDQIDTNASDITVNQGAIATNNSAIGANTAAIGTNTTNIGTNATAISTNATNITTAQNAADAAQNDLNAYKWSVNVISATSTVGLLNRQITIVKADNVTMNLPAPSAGDMVTVKMDSIRAACVVNSAAGIDGFGTSYTLSSSYESISLVSDGTQWYII